MTALLTIGHSNRPLDDTLALLLTHDVSLLVDVRSHPGSRHVPQYNTSTLSQEVEHVGIEYTHLPELGGYRNGGNFSHPEQTAAWKNQSFRNYADYTLSNDQYLEGIDLLLKHVADHEPHHVAIMCAEAVPWRCHRLLIANTLVVLAQPVTHIMDNGKNIEHALGIFGPTPVVIEDVVTYPNTQRSLF